MTTNLFRKKPVVVEAAQWHKNGDHPADYDADEGGTENGVDRVFTGSERKANGWEGGVVRYFRRPDVSGETLCKHCNVRMHEHGWIDTLEGGHIVCPGDWIITGVQGERYPCKPDIFARTYEPADATRVPSATEGEPYQQLLQSWDKLAASTATSPWEKAYRLSRANAAKELRAAIKNLTPPLLPGDQAGRTA